CGNFSGATLVSCRQTASGWCFSKNSSTRSIRARREFTFQVAISIWATSGGSSPKLEQHHREGGPVLVGQWVLIAQQAEQVQHRGLAGVVLELPIGAHDLQEPLQRGLPLPVLRVHASEGVLR